MPFGHYTLHADVGGAPAVAELDVASDTANHVVLSPSTAVKEIGRTAGGTRGVRGTPVSENAILSSAIATLPRGDSLNGIVDKYRAWRVFRTTSRSPTVSTASPTNSTASAAARLLREFQRGDGSGDVEAVEVFTGAFPAEYGGSRLGALVNLVGASARRPHAPGTRNAHARTRHVRRRETSLTEAVRLGKTALFLPARWNGRIAGSTRRPPIRFTTPQTARTSSSAPSRNSDPRETLALDLSQTTALFQVPINPTANPNDPVLYAPGTDDVQREYSRFASASFTHTTEDGLGFVQIVPWVRSFRLVYAGDPRTICSDVPEPDTGLPVFQNGLQQDQRATYAGLRASYARSSDIHSYKIGFDVARESYQNTGFIALANNGGTVSGDVAQAGATLGAYIQDRWALGQRFAINAGLRLDGRPASFQAAS